MIELVAESALLLLSGLVICYGMRNRSPSQRHAVWVTVIAAGLLLPLLSFALNSGGFTIEFPLPNGSPAVLAAFHGDHVGDSTNALAEHALGVGHAATASDIESILALIWGAGTAFVLLRLAWQLTHVCAVTHRSLPTPQNCVGQRSVERCGARVRSSREISIPVVWGWPRSVILVPADFESWPTDSRVTALEHERAHIARRDWLTWLLSQLACALYWFNPLVWHAANRMRTEAEHACDDLVLSTGVRPSAYADHLLEIVERRRGPRYAPVVSVSGADVATRVRAVLDPLRPRHPATPRMRSRWVLVLASIGLAVASPEDSGSSLAASWARACQSPPAKQWIIGFAIESPRSTLDLGGWRLPGSRRDGPLLSERVEGPGAGRALWDQHGFRRDRAWNPPPADVRYRRAVLALVSQDGTAVVVDQARMHTMWLPFGSDHPLRWLGTFEATESASWLASLARSCTGPAQEQLVSLAAR